MAFVKFSKEKNREIIKHILLQRNFNNAIITDKGQELTKLTAIEEFYPAKKGYLFDEN